MKRDRVWYVVLNSHRARILRSLPEADEPPPTEIRLQATRPTLRKALSDLGSANRPAAGTGNGASAACAAGPSPAGDPLHADTLRFLREVLHYLGDQLDAGAFDGLVLIAAPDILAIWQGEAPAGLKAVVLRQEVSNFTRLPIVRLASAIREMLAQ